MNMTVGDLQFNFVDGKLTLKYVSVSFNAGTFPNNLNGNLQVTTDDGINPTSATLEADIKAAAKTKIQALVAEEPAEAEG
ncbi:hypothetical protein N7X58_02160 [Leuconostoc mesenteroides]|uniref:hypothetical protein n=1 Tax=Leuconostoc mesenteroides TaxID=1245 RepID=UPI0021D25795|nr:hypothetical protein [Leuconostoc mesenteroides]MCU4664299.1 hypothetical protein [Leuconostoc mesenteroides]